MVAHRCCPNRRIIMRVDQLFLQNGTFLSVSRNSLRLSRRICNTVENEVHETVNSNLGVSIRTLFRLYDVGTTIHRILYEHVMNAYYMQ